MRCDPRVSHRSGDAAELNAAADDVVVEGVPVGELGEEEEEEEETEETEETEVVEEEEEVEEEVEEAALASISPRPPLRTGAGPRKAGKCVIW